MKHTAVLASLLIGLLVSGDPAHAKCPSILVRVQGDVLGQFQEGDELLLRFVYSPKRVETSSPQPVKDKTFTLLGAYSTYKRSSVFQGDVCGAAPRQIQLFMRDRNGAVLDTVDLITPDELTGEIEMSFGKKQVVVVHRTLGSGS
ncbi:MAG TPA: hypothetical protein VN087_19225 [Verrucomicrobiae bacterium]|jgi:hypothetical protein|nr:hypothetical protein [Verrucomicrobiae bacterium]